jgi:hypothetical protein
MSMMNPVGGAIARIKWKSVLALIIVIAAMYFLVKSFPTGYSVKNNIGLKVSSNPEQISPGYISTINVEIKNLNRERMITVGVKAKTSDQSMFFTETYSGEYFRGGITIGPQETRKLRFDVKSKAGSLEGRYGVTVYAIEDGKVEGVEDTLFIEVEEG